MTEWTKMGLRARDLAAGFAMERSGATAIEYGIIAGSLSIAIAVSVNGVGSALDAIFVAVQGLF